MAATPGPAQATSQSLREELPRFEQLSRGLVLLEEELSPSLFARVEEFRRRLLRHLEAVGPVRDRTAAADPYAEDHRRFAEAVKVLDWLLDIVRHDGHGGNRQALGQYGKILAEAVRDHLGREEHDAPNGREPPARPPRRSPGQG